MRRSTSGTARPGLGAHLDLFVHVAGHHRRLEVRARQQRAGLRHAVAAEDVDAAFQRRLGQALGQRRAADHHLPALQVDVLARGTRSASCAGWSARSARRWRLPRADQRQQRFRRVAAGIDLLHAHQRGHIRQPPRVDVEHRRDRHVHVAFAMKRPMLARHAERRQVGHRVQHQLAVAEVHALRQPGGAGGVEGRRARVLVEVGELVVGRARRRPAARTRRRTRSMTCGLSAASLISTNFCTVSSLSLDAVRASAGTRR